MVTVAIILIIIITIIIVDTTKKPNKMHGWLYLNLANEEKVWPENEHLTRPGVVSHTDRHTHTHSWKISDKNQSVGRRLLDQIIDVQRG